MAAPYVNTTGTLLVKVESSYGVDPTPVAADACWVEVDKRALEPDIAMRDRKALRPSPIDLIPVPGERCWKVAVETEFKNIGTAGTPGMVGRLLQAAGFLETDNGTTDDTYTPLLTNGKSLTLWEYRGGHKLVANGVRFDKMTIGGKQGESATIKCEGKGLYAAPTDSAIISTPVLETTPPIITGVGGTFAFNGFALLLREFSIEVGTGLADRKNFGATSGYTGFVQTRYSCKFKLKAELESIADQPFLANILSSDDAAWDQTLGTTAGNKIDIDMPRARLTACKFGNDGGVAIVDLEGVASDSTDNALNDWLTIKLY